MRRVKRRIWSGMVLEQEIYTCSEGVPAKLARPRLRFRDEAQRRAHREAQGLREFIRSVNATFSCGGGLYSTLTFDDAHEVHTFEEAKRIRAAYVRRLQRRHPDAVVFAVLGRGENTSRIHMHMLTLHVPEEDIIALWRQGAVKRVEPMRERNILRGGMAVGRDYSGLAAYLWRHWTPEQGGHHVFKTRNAKKCEREDAAECRTSYSETKPPKVPRAPEGYEWVLCDYMGTSYGFQWFKWVMTPIKKKGKPGRPVKVKSDENGNT